MPTSYKDAGVSVEAGNRLVDRIKSTLSNHQPRELLEEVGGFAALARVPKHLENPILVTATDGVGTKLELLIQHDQLHTVGQDLVAMCANDVLVCGAQPSQFLDYLATGKLDVDQAETVIRGIALACEMAGCGLVGGETAEMPGFYTEGTFDLAGFCVGWVEEAEILSAKHVQPGDIVLGLASSGPHSNGYSLIRKLLRENVQPESSILETILAPTRIYVKPVVTQRQHIHAMAHITGGGFRDNLPRSLPKALEAVINLSAWEQPSVFKWLQETSGLQSQDMFTTFNCGIGMVLFVPADSADTVASELTAQGEQVYLLGEIKPPGSKLNPNQLAVGHDRFEYG